MLCEFERALGCVSDRHSVSSYTPGQYTAVASANTNFSAAFAVGVETESYSNVSDLSSCYSGMNTSTSDIFFQPTFNGQGADVQVRCDVYALYDQVVSFSNGMATVQF